MSVKTIVISLAVALLVILLIGLAANQIPADEEVYTVQMNAPDGETIGEIRLSETKAGVLMLLDLEGLSAGGEHGFHVHETADCDGENGFTGAGGHYNPFGNAHGMKHPEGKHAGDMPNIVPDSDGTLNTRVLNTAVTLQTETDGMNRAPLFDEDGSALVIHANADDHMSQPSGAAGPRIACGEIMEE